MKAQKPWFSHYYQTKIVAAAWCSYYLLFCKRNSNCFAPDTIVWQPDAKHLDCHKNSFEDRGPFGRPGGLRLGCQPFCKQFFARQLCDTSERPSLATRPMGPKSLVVPDS